jgi:hypothetical protein
LAVGHETAAHQVGVIFRTAAGSLGRLRLKPDQNGYSRRMTLFRAIDPHGEVVATGDFDSAEAAYRWFVNSIADNYKMGWRMEVSDDGLWAHFDDTGGFTAPMSRRRSPR